jgi:hypothetical protein
VHGLLSITMEKKTRLNTVSAITQVTVNTISLSCFDSQGKADVTLTFVELGHSTRRKRRRSTMEPRVYFVEGIYLS